MNQLSQIAAPVMVQPPPLGATPGQAHVPCAGLATGAAGGAGATGGATQGPATGQANGPLWVSAPGNSPGAAGQGNPAGFAESVRQAMQEASGQTSQSAGAEESAQGDAAETSAIRAKFSGTSPTSTGAVGGTGRPSSSLFFPAGTPLGAPLDTAALSGVSMQRAPVSLQSPTEAGTGAHGAGTEGAPPVILMATSSPADKGASVGKKGASNAGNSGTKGKGLAAPASSNDKHVPSAATSSSMSFCSFAAPVTAPAVLQDAALGTRGMGAGSNAIEGTTPLGTQRDGTGQATTLTAVLHGAGKAAGWPQQNGAPAGNLLTRVQAEKDGTTGAPALVGPDAQATKQGPSGGPSPVAASSGQAVAKEAQASARAASTDPMAQVENAGTSFAPSAISGVEGTAGNKVFGKADSPVSQGVGHPVGLLAGATDGLQGTNGLHGSTHAPGGMDGRLAGGFSAGPTENAQNLLTGAHGATANGPHPLAGAGILGTTLVNGHAWTVAGGMGAAGPASGVGGASASSLSASDAFAALDHAAAGEAPRLLHVAPNQLAVGVSDPKLGWLEVRAERLGGNLTAQVAAGSTTSHDALTASLPEMAGYLHEQRAGVAYLSVASQLAGNAGQGGQNAPGGGGQPQGGPGPSASGAITNVPSTASVSSVNGNPSSSKQEVVFEGGAAMPSMQGWRSLNVRA